jgi:hypothetical protein
MSLVKWAIQITTRSIIEKPSVSSRSSRFSNCLNESTKKVSTISRLTSEASYLAALASVAKFTCESCWLPVTGGAGPGGYVGGEMEGVGLLAASEKAKPVWIVVKGISDFADDQQRAEVEAMRAEACLNAVRFLLAALQKADKVLVE